jgi:hypothetical protein
MSPPISWQTFRDYITRHTAPDSCHQPDFQRSGDIIFIYIYSISIKSSLKPPRGPEYEWLCPICYIPDARQMNSGKELAIIHLTTPKCVVLSNR